MVLSRIAEYFDASPLEIQNHISNGNSFRKIQLIKVSMNLQNPPMRVTRDC